MSALRTLKRSICERETGERAPKHRGSRFATGRATRDNRRNRARRRSAIAKASRKGNR